MFRRWLFAVLWVVLFVILAFGITCATVWPKDAHRGRRARTRFIRLAEFLGLYSAQHIYAAGLGGEEAASATATALPKSGVEIPSSVEILSYKEMVAVIKDTLDVIFKAAAFFSFIAGMFLWVYLKNIGWSGIFLESVGSGAGLVAVVIAALLFAFSVSVFFVVPSLFVMALIAPYDSEKLLPDHVPQALRGVIFLWFVALAAVFIDNLDHSGYLLLFPVVMPFVIVLLHWNSLRGLNLISRRRCAPILFRHKIAEAGLIGVGGSCALISTAFPLQLAFKVAGRIPGIEIYSIWWGYLIIFVVTAVAFFPGLVFLNLRRFIGGSSRPLRLAVVAVFVSAYLVLSVGVVANPVSTMLLGAVGIFSNEEKYFYIGQSSVSNAFMKAGFDGIQKSKQHTAMGAQEGLLLRGYLRYSLGGVKLICKNSLDVGSGKATSLMGYSRSIMEVSSDGKGCVATYGAEAREVKI